MGQLLRARSPEARAARREAILSSVKRLLEQHEPHELAMEAVARHARLAKGTVFLYFPTKEALLAELLEQQLDLWLGTLHELVASDDRAWQSATLADTIVSSFAAQPVLDRLRTRALSRRAMQRLFGTGSLIEQRLGLTHPGDGVLLLKLSYAMMTGCDDYDDVRTGLTILFNGFHRKAARSAGAPR